MNIMNLNKKLKHATTTFFCPVTKKQIFLGSKNFELSVVTFFRKGVL